MVWLSKGGEKMIGKFLRLVIILLMVVAIAGIGGTAQADSENSAVVINDFTCGLINASGGFFTAPGGHAVYSNDANGNSMVACHAGLPPGEYPEGAIKWNYANTGETCNTFFGQTTDWQEIVTPGGKAILVCHINPGS